MPETEPVLRVAVTGAGGFIGSALVASLRERGAEVLRIVRREAGAGEIAWDPDAGSIEAEKLEGLDCVVHLAGESIFGLWTSAKKRRILESRDRGTRLLSRALAGLDRRPGVLVSASGVGFYGDAGDVTLTEASPAGDDFLATVCLAWEKGAEAAAEAGIRVVHTRFGLVLHPAGGSLRLMRHAFRWGVGARLGNGEQWMSWIALADAVRAIEFAFADELLAGPVNACAPEPVTNAAFTRILAESMRRPARLAIPAPVLRIFTAGMGEALLLVSQRAIPAMLESHGFEFRQPRLAEALTPGGVD